MLSYKSSNTRRHKDGFTVFGFRGTLITTANAEPFNVQFGITSLPPQQASAERLLQLRRGHWAIENLSHRTRDVLLGEDASQVRCGNIPQVMAALRNTVLTLLRTCGHTHIAKAFRFFAAHSTDALKIIQKTESDN